MDELIEDRENTQRNDNHARRLTVDHGEFAADEVPGCVSYLGHARRGGRGVGSGLNKAAVE